MSLQRLAHRIATVAALRGRTLAGDGVSDSAIPPIEQLVAGQRKPFLAVYTGEEQRQWRGLNPADMDDDQLTIMIEIGVTAQMQIGDGEDYAWAYPVPTDAGMETTLDIIERQIRIAFNDEASPWAELWRTLHFGDPQYRSVPGAKAEDGLRFAGRFLEVKVNPYNEPAFGPAATGIWAEFLEAIEGDEELDVYGPVLRSLIEADSAPVDWIAVQRRFGLDAGEAAALLISSAEGTPPGTVITDPVGDALPEEPTP